MLHNVAEKAVEDLQSRVNFGRNLTTDKAEQQIEQVLPYVRIFVLLHGALNLYSHIANFMCESDG